jgi:pyruvate dehydrogenase E1 component alpha subunit
MQGLDRVALCFFGDGATNEGAFHEGMNLAAIWKLPVIFLCENNGYAVSTPARVALPVKDVAERAAAYAMPAAIVDGQDVDAVEAVVAEAVARARSGGGPTLIEAKTYRYADHAVNMGRLLLDRGAEVDEWRKRDPLPLYRARLIEAGADAALLDAVEREVAEEVADAIAFARSSPYPEQAEAFDHVFVERVVIPAHLAA